MAASDSSSSSTMTTQQVLSVKVDSNMASVLPFLNLPPDVALTADQFWSIYTFATQLAEHLTKFNGDIKDEEVNERGALLQTQLRQVPRGISEASGLLVYFIYDHEHEHEHASTGEEHGAVSNISAMALTTDYKLLDDSALHGCECDSRNKEFKSFLQGLLCTFRRTVGEI